MARRKAPPPNRRVGLQRLDVAVVSRVAALESTDKVGPAGPAPRYRRTRAPVPTGLGTRLVAGRGVAGREHDPVGVG